MFAYINDLTAYLIIKEVAAAINSDGANKRSADSVRTSTLTTRDIIQSIIEAIPDVAKLIKETRAAQQPAIQPRQSGQHPKTPRLPRQENHLGFPRRQPHPRPTRHSRQVALGQQSLRP